MRKALRNAVLATLAGTMVMSTAEAGSVAGNGGATEITQILNNVELVQQSAQMYQEVEQTIQQVSMMEQQLKNLIQAPAMVWGTINADLGQLTTIVAQGQALGYALTNIDSQFSAKFPGYTTKLGAGYKAQANAWTQTSMDSLRSALDTAGLQSNQFASESAAMDSINAMAGSAPGQLQAAQAGIMVATQEVQQLQKLRQLFMTQMQAQNAVLAKQEQQAANDRATMDAHFVPYTSTAPTFTSNGGKN